MTHQPGRFDRALTVAAAIAAASLFVPLFIPLLTGRVFTIDDLSVFHLPLRYLYSSSLANGRSFVWTPMLFGGFYVHAEGQVGMLHPAHWILYRMLPLSIAFNVELIASYVFSFLGMWLLLRRIGLSAAARTVGAIAFAFSGFNLLHLCHMNAVAIAAHIPWLLLACDHGLNDAGVRRRRALAGVALLIGSEVLLGYPQYVWISALACAVWSMVRTTRRAALAPLAGAAILGLLIGGAQLLPTADLLQRSARATLSAEFPYMLSLHPFNILQLWSPYVFPFRVYAQPREMFVHELGLYSGSFATLAIVWVLWRRRHLPSGDVVVAAGILSVAGLILALGRYGYVYDVMTFLPVVSKFRAPARYLLLLHLGLALFVAMAYDDLVNISRRTRARVRRPLWIWLPLALSVATAAAAVMWPHRFTTIPDQPVLGGFLVVGTILIGVTTILVADAASGAGPGLLLLPLLIAADLGFWGYTYNWGSPPASIAQVAASADAPPATASAVHSTTRDRKINLLLLRDIKVFRPYVGLPPTRTTSWDDPVTYRRAGVEWLRTAEGWTKVDGPFPRLRIVNEDAGRDDVRVELVTDVPGRLEIHVNAQRPAILATTETYHDGWRAQANKHVVSTLRQDGDFLAVNLEPGDYRLVLEFKPASLQRGWQLSLGGIVFTALLLGLPQTKMTRWRPPKMTR